MIPEKIIKIKNNEEDFTIVNSVIEGSIIKLIEAAIKSREENEIAAKENKISTIKTKIENDDENHATRLATKQKTCQVCGKVCLNKKGVEIHMRIHK